MKEFAIYLMALFYFAAGVMHMVRPGGFVKIMPGYLPFPLQLVYISGLCEMTFATLLLFPVTRPTGAWLIIILLIAVFPANIQMAVDFYQRKNPFLWIALMRLPLQFVLIWWAWLYTKS